MELFIIEQTRCPPAKRSRFYRRFVMREMLRVCRAQWGENPGRVWTKEPRAYYALRDIERVAERGA